MLWSLWILNYLNFEHRQSILMVLYSVLYSFFWLLVKIHIQLLFSCSFNCYPSSIFLVYMCCSLCFTLVIHTFEFDLYLSLQKTAKFLWWGFYFHILLHFYLNFTLCGQVCDFFKRRSSEHSPAKANSQENYTFTENSGIQLLGQIKNGSCRPRALLFKVLADAAGLENKLMVVIINILCC